jgi:phytanoyl-CoA hydroxylase
MATGVICESAQPASDYAEHGYTVMRSVVPADKIERLLRVYASQIVHSKDRFFRQNTSRYEANKVTSNDYVRQSFLDIHDYRKYPGFSEAAREIFCGPEILGALGEATGAKHHNLMQTMLFDLNTATWPHQDWYYLDSVPNGHLTGAWIALEDIQEKAGRFYVIPDSHHCDFGARDSGVTLEMWIKRVGAYVEQNQATLHAPALRRGDVLFWNSRTVHGSLPTQDENYSRKSLTAHYLPADLGFGNIFASRPNIRYQEYAGVKYYRNQPDYSLANHLVFSIKAAVYNYPVVRESLRPLRELGRRLQTGARSLRS